MKKLNAKGFSAPLVLGALLIIGAIAGAGWYIFNKQHEQEYKEDLSSIGEINDIEAEPVFADSEGYITLHDWGVKFKLTNTAEGSYYKLYKTVDGAHILYFHNTNYDNMKNINGESCENDQPMFAVSRALPDDPEVEHISIDGQLIDGYLYLGQGSSQSAPMCASLSHPDEDYLPDQNIETAFYEYRDALAESFTSIVSIK
jgi:hypothetical protein